MNLLQKFGQFLLRRKAWNYGQWFNRPGSGDTQDTREIYRWSVWVQSAVRIKAGEIRTAPLKFYEANGDEFKYPPGFKEFFAAPAVGVDGKRVAIGEVEHQLIGWLDLKGLAIIVLGDDWLLPFPASRQPTPFVIARPDRVRRVFSGQELAGYVFTDGFGRSHQLIPEQVICIEYWNPYAMPAQTMEWGLPPLDAVQSAANAEIYAGLYTKNLSRNAGDQGVYITAKSQLTDPQQEQVVAALREKRQAALTGDFRAVFLTGDITVEDSKVTPPDANFLQGRIQNREEIYVGLGVPPSMATAHAQYSVGAASDRYALITQTCQPLGKKIMAPFTLLGSKLALREIVAELDWDENDVMQEVRRSRVDSAIKLWGTGMPMDKISDYLDMALPEFPGNDVGYLPFSVSPVDTLGDGNDGGTKPTGPAIPVAEAGSDSASAIAEAKAALTTLMLSRAARKSLPAPVIEIVDRALSPRQHASWRDVEQSRRKGEKLTHGAVTKNLLVARSQVLANIERYVPAEGTKAMTKASGEQLNFDKALFHKGLLDSLAKAARINLHASSQMVVDEVGGDDAWKLPDERVLQFIKQRENLLSGVPDEVFATVQRELDAGISAGEGKGDLANRIRGTFNTINRGRAEVIAQTETGAAYGSGRNEGMKATGVEFKEWVASPDDRTREAHALASGQVVGVEDPFEVGGSKLMYPGDPSLGAPGDEVINCRCVSVPSFMSPDEQMGAEPAKVRRVTKVNGRHHA